MDLAGAVSVPVDLLVDAGLLNLEQVHELRDEMYRRCYPVVLDCCA